MLNKTTFLTAILFMTLADSREEGEPESSSAFLTRLGDSYIGLLRNSKVDTAAHTAVVPVEENDGQKRSKKSPSSLEVKGQNPKDKLSGSMDHGDIF